MTCANGDRSEGDWRGNKMNVGTGCTDVNVNR